MKILVIGSGAREHALVWKLAQSRYVKKIWCAPGNPGTADVAENLFIPADDIEKLFLFARMEKPDLTVVGPELPAVWGIADKFRSYGLSVFCPNKRAAEFEASKAYAQKFMELNRIPAPIGDVFHEPALAKGFAEEFGGKVVVKANGLCSGKGALVCENMQDASEAIDRMLVRREFGEAGVPVVIQEKLEGVEVSVHALCDGKTFRMFPIAQDHKRLLDGDKGPNTGGMGAVAPYPLISEKDLREIRDKILSRWLIGCHEENTVYRGLIYPGIMLTKSGPKVLEWNVRFGDPECQVLMMLLQSDLAQLLYDTAKGQLDEADLRFKPGTAACVVLASGNYPDSKKIRTGLPISFVDDCEARHPKVKIFHAGTSVSCAVSGRMQLVTAGGRVLSVTAYDHDPESALAEAYKAAEEIDFSGMQFRRDIGAKALSKPEIFAPTAAVS